MNTSLETTPSDPGGLPSGGGQSHWGPEQWELQMRMMGGSTGMLAGEGCDLVCASEWSLWLQQGRGWAQRRCTGRGAVGFQSDSHGEIHLN